VLAKAGIFSLLDGDEFLALIEEQDKERLTEHPLPRDTSQNA